MPEAGCVMKVRDLMVTAPITISESADITRAIHTMKSSRIRHLPVVDRDKRLKGFVTLADLKIGLMPAMVTDVDLEDLIIRDPVTVSPEDRIEQAARKIYQYKISGMPVVAEGILVGIITETDIFRAFIDMMGILRGDSLIEVVVDETTDALNRAIGVVTAHGGAIVSVSMTPRMDQVDQMDQGDHTEHVDRTDDQMDHRRICCIRLQGGDITSIVSALKQAGFAIADTTE